MDLYNVLKRLGLKIVTWKKCMRVVHSLKSVVRFASLWDAKKLLHFHTRFLLPPDIAKPPGMFLSKTRVRGHPDADAEKHNLVLSSVLPS